MSYIVILLLEFEANLKGIIVDDHVGIQINSHCLSPGIVLVLVLVEAEHVLVQFCTTSMVEKSKDEAIGSCRCVLSFDTFRWNHTVILLLDF